MKPYLLSLCTWLLLASLATAGSVSPFSYNGRNYDASTPGFVLFQDSGLSQTEWDRQEGAMRDRLGNQLYRSYVANGNNIYDTYARADLQNKFHPLVAYFLAQDYARTPWADWDTGVFLGTRGYYIEIVGSEFAP